MDKPQSKLRTKSTTSHKLSNSITQTDIECLNEYVLIKVFNFLNINDKLTCSNVCTRWQRILNSTICQPKRLSITVNSNVAIKELNNVNCEHSTDETISEQLTLVDYLNHNLLYNELFSNLNLLILNLIFCDHSPVLDFSQLICLKHLELHGDYYAFRDQTAYPSVEHLFVERLKPTLFQHFPNLRCLCLNQLKIDKTNDDPASSNVVNQSSNESNSECRSCDESCDESCDQLGTNKFTRKPIQLSACTSLTKFKINYVPIQSSNDSNELLQSLSSITPSLEQLYVGLSFGENDDFESRLDLELDSKISSLNTTNSSTVPSSNSTTTTSSSNNLRTNCTLNKMLDSIKRLKKLKLIEIEFDLEHMTNLNSVNSFLLNISYELAQLKLRLRTHLKFTKSLDLTSTDVFEFASYLKSNYTNELNEIIINGKCFNLKELKSLLKYYHLINVEELYITGKDLALFNKPTVYNYLKEVNTLCFEANPGVRLNDILNNLAKVKYVYFDCPAVNQEQLNQLPILRPNLEYLAIEEFNAHLDLEFATKFNGLRSLYLGRLERIHLAQLVKLIEQSKNLTYLNIECKLLGKSLDQVIRLFATNARNSINFYHLNLSLANFQFNSFELESLIKSYKIPNLKISFYQ